jgi:WD40 repeat protein
VAELWAATGKLTEEETRTLCANMADLSLLTLDCTVPGGALSLHDVIRDHLRATLNSKLAQLNKAILDALEEKHLRTDPVTGAKVPAWWQIQDGYLSEYLISHFLDAERISEAETLAGDLRWVRARLHQRGPAAPAADLTRIPTATAARLASDLTRAAHILTPTSPVHALDAVLDSRLGALPHWREQPPVAAKSNARLTNRWDPPDLPSSAVHRILVGHNASVSGVAWSLDGTRLATASSDHTARIWDPTTGREIRVLSHSNNVYAAAWSPDGTRLATTSDDHTARTWDPTTGTVLHTLTGHSKTIYTVAWSPDSARLAAMSVNNLHIWDPATGWEIRILNDTFAATSAVAWSPDSTRITTVSRNDAHIWDPATGTVLHTLTGHSNTVLAVAWSPDGSRLATASSDHAVRIWNPTSEVENQVHRPGDPPAAKKAQSPETGVWDHTARIWGPATHEALNRLAYDANHADDVVAVRWSPDGHRLATAFEDDTISIWHAATGVLLRTLIGHTSEVTAIAWSPDGTRLATSSWDHTVRIWDPTTGTAIHTLTGHTLTVTDLAWSTDNTRLASTSEDCTVRIWNPADGCLQTLMRVDGQLSACAWTAAGDGLVVEGAHGLYGFDFHPGV